MARPLRIQFPGALYHVTSRGQEKGRIVRDEHDRWRRVDWLARTVQEFGWRLHAFVLMTNHDHLFVETPNPDLARGMQYLNGSYTSYFNARHRRVGHLFQGRYKAILIENEGHYREVSRYIHLNPVRARLVPRPEDWPWGSYPSYHRSRGGLSWVSTARVLGEFGREETSARKAYRRFVAAGIEGPLESPLQAAVHGLVLGSDAFLTRVQQAVAGRPPDPAVPDLKRLAGSPSMSSIVEAVARHFGVDPHEWAPGRRCEHIGRAMGAYIARRRFRLPESAVASALGYRGHSAIHSALRRVESSLPRLRDDVDSIAASVATGLKAL